MEYSNIIVTGVVSLISTITGSIVSWFLAKKKYDTEVDSNEIENLKESLKFYENIVEDNNKKLKFYITLVEENRVEVYRLKSIIHKLVDKACINSDCIKRTFFSKEEVKDILGEITLPEND